MRSEHLERGNSWWFIIVGGWLHGLYLAANSRKVPQNVVTFSYWMNILWEEGMWLLIQTPLMASGVFTPLFLSSTPLGSLSVTGRTSPYGKQWRHFWQHSPKDSVSHESPVLEQFGVIVKNANTWALYKPCWIKGDESLESVHAIRSPIVS